MGVIFLMSTLTLGGGIANVNACQLEGVGGKNEANFGQRKLWTAPKQLENIDITNLITTK